MAGRRPATADGHHADFAFDLLQELDCLARNFKPLSFRLVLDEGNRDPNTCTRAFTLTAIHAYMMNYLIII